MYYFGRSLKKENTVVIFTERHTPTRKSHGSLYPFVFGSYKSKEDAIKAAVWQYNPETYKFVNGHGKTLQLAMEG